MITAIIRNKSNTLVLDFPRSIYAAAFNEADIGDCVYYGFDSVIPQITSEMFGSMSDVQALNKLAAEISIMSEAEQVKFKAVLDAENTTSIHDALNAAQNLWRYEFTAEPDTADGFFKKYIYENTSTEFDSKWLENLLPRNEADKLLGRLGATLTDYGVISARNGHLFEPVPYDEPEVKEIKTQAMTEEKLDVIEVLDRIALFSNGRLMPEQIPEGLYAYVSDCISKRIKANNGERNKYYIENNHPAIIDAGTFARVQEEIARRSGKPKVKQKGTKTELSRYSSKYALSELLICGECRTPYRRCTWTAKGKRKIVWRCINRLDYGKKYCHHSPSIEETLLQDAVMRAIMQTAKQNVEVLKTLKIHIGMGLTDEVTEDKTLDIQIRIAEIDAEFQKMLKAVSADNADDIDEERITELMNEKQRLTVQLEQYAAMRQKRESAKSRLDEIYTILDGLQNHPMEYNDKLVRQIIECIVVESKEKIKVVFIGGTEIEMTL